MPGVFEGRKAMIGSCIRRISGPRFVNSCIGVYCSIYVTFLLSFRWFLMVLHANTSIRTFMKILRQVMVMFEETLRNKKIQHFMFVFAGFQQMQPFFSGQDIFPYRSSNKHFKHFLSNHLISISLNIQKLSHWTWALRSPYFIYWRVIWSERKKERIIINLSKYVRWRLGDHDRMNRASTSVRVENFNCQ